MTKILAKASIAGMPCTYIIFREAVTAPYIAAIMTHKRKKIAIRSAHCVSDMVSDQINPAARKPLYRPWLAASTFVAGNNSAGSDLKTFLPVVSQANISNHRKHKCNNATSPMRMIDSKLICNRLDLLKIPFKLDGGEVCKYEL